MDPWGGAWPLDYGLGELAAEGRAWPAQHEGLAAEGCAWPEQLEACEESDLPGNTWPRPAATPAKGEPGFEPSRREKPLRLLYEYSAAESATWRPLVLDEDRRCFGFLWPKAISAERSADYLKRLLDLAPWVDLQNTKGTGVTRATCWYSWGGCTCDYTYGKDTRMTNSRFLKMEAEELDEGPFEDEAAIAEDSTSPAGKASGVLDESSDFSEFMDEFRSHVFGQLFPGLKQEAWPNSANLNLYRDGRQAVGWHADDESLFRGKDTDCPVVSISLGAAREFWIALKKGSDPDARSIVEVDLTDGDMLTMEGRLQRHCLHMVPKGNPREPIREERINITFRWIRDHRHHCPLRQRKRREVVPAALKGIFGVGETAELSQKSAGFTPSAPLHFGNAYTRCWSYEISMGVLANPDWLEIRLCDGCKHVCYAEGRPCCEGQGSWSGHWFCRKCWAKWEPDSVPELPPSLSAHLEQTHGQLEQLHAAYRMQAAVEAAASVQAATMAAVQAALIQTSLLSLGAAAPRASPLLRHDAAMTGATAYPGIAQLDSAIVMSQARRWQLWSSDASGASRSSFGLAQVGEASSSVTEMSALLGRQALPSKLCAGGYSLFVSGTAPAREDPGLERGGRWLLALSPKRHGHEVYASLLDEVWHETTRCLLSGDFHNSAKVCGAAVSVRAASNAEQGSTERSAKVAVWLAEAGDDVPLVGVGKLWRDVLAQLSVRVGKSVPDNRWRLSFESFKQQAVTRRI
eukprot:TRINITY_DN12958_c0_g1_i3.p1 TRINITY_DN12958_c0_g1~~TRINITY_DN12958_c0_g1_i3.p1  ORF type:complete len:746 (+),score=150.22 TRINITY_DN12958_c0_g1_i3:41-2278(+)